MASRIGWRLALKVFGVGGALALFLNACDQVVIVERVVLVNPTSYDVLVDVRGEGDSSWHPLGIARRNSQTLQEDVIDVGDTWVFRFRYAGEHLGEDRIRGSRLKSNRWRYQIPEEVGKKLQDKGYPPSIG